MAEELSIIIDADVEGAKQGINSITDVINNFAKQGKLSIGVVEQALVQLRGVIKQTTDPADLRKLNDAYSELQRKLNSLKITGGLESQLNGISRATRLAHTELDQMSRSIGSIASGNGRAIEGLSQIAFSFEQLRGQTGSTKSALAELSATLLSPAGLLVAGAALAPLIEEIGSNFLSMADGSRQAKIDLEDLTRSLIASRSAIQGFNEDIDQAAITRKLKIDIETPPGLDRSVKELGADLDAAQIKIINTGAALKSYQDQLERVEAATKKVSTQQAKLSLGSLQFERNKTTLENNEKQIELLKKQIQDAQKELTKAQGDVINIPLKIQLTKLDEARTDGKKQLEEFNRSVIALAKEAEKVFAVPISLKFDETDLSPDKLAKAKQVLEGIKDFTIKARVDIELPDIKELPKEQVQKFFINVPDALQDAINKGIIEAPEGITFPVKLALDPEHAFDEDINKLEAEFKNKGLEIPVDIQVAIADGSLKGVDLFSALQKALKPAELTKQLSDEINKSINDALKNISTEGLSAIGDAIGEALSGGDIGKSFEKFGDTLGSAVQALGKQIIALGIAAALTKKAISSLFANPLVAVAAGIALVAIGAALKNLIGGGLQGFAKGGDPPVGKPSIVGEKGWEIFVPKVPGTIISHEKSVQLLNRSVDVSSVKEHESIKEYLITTKINQAIKEQFKNISESIKEGIKVALVPVHTQLSETLKSIATTSEKLTAYSYKLHEVNNNNIQSLKESIVKTSESEKHFQEKSVIEKYLKEFKQVTSDKDNHSSFEKITSDVRAVISSIDKTITTSFTSKIEKLIDKVSAQSKIINIERIINNTVLSDKISSLKQMSFHDLEHKLHIPAFAQGGAVFGPTLAILGEGFGISRSNPEFVLTRDQLKGVQGGTLDVNIGVNGELTLQRGTLGIALNQEIRSHLRTNGKKPF